MPEEKPLHDADTGNKIKKLTLPDGFRVGIVNLDNILKEVAELNLTDAQAIKAELLRKVKRGNYVPSGAENEYSTALFQEYQKKFSNPGAVKDGDKPEEHKHTAG